MRGRMGGMVPNRLGLGVMLSPVGAVLIFIAVTMNTGDGMFGGIAQRGPIAILGTILLMKGVDQIVRGLRDRANAVKQSKLIRTPIGRQTALASLLADLDQQLAEAESLAAEPGDDATLLRARKAITELREARRDVDAKLRGQ